jgi:hypothetical protein
MGIEVEESLQPGLWKFDVSVIGFPAFALDSGEACQADAGNGSGIGSEF